MTPRAREGPELEERKERRGKPWKEGGGKTREAEPKRRREQGGWKRGATGKEQEGTQNKTQLRLATSPQPVLAHTGLLLLLVPSTFPRKVLRINKIHMYHT